MGSIGTLPDPWDWTILAGDMNRVMFEFYADDMPVNITGWEVRAQTRLSKTDPDVALEATCVVTAGSSGQATVEWDGEAARALLTDENDWRGVWDLETQAPGDPLPRTWVAGSFTIVWDTTREGVVLGVSRNVRADHPAGSGFRASSSGTRGRLNPSGLRPA